MLYQQSYCCPKRSLKKKKKKKKKRKKERERNQNCIIHTFNNHQGMPTTQIPYTLTIHPNQQSHLVGQVSKVGNLSQG